MPNEFSHIFMRGGDKVLKFKHRQCFLTTGKRILKNEKDASSGNRTRAARVAGEHSTTEPTMPAHFQIDNFQYASYAVLIACNHGGCSCGRVVKATHSK